MFSRRLLIVAAATVLASAAQADTIFVDDDAPLGGDGGERADRRAESGAY